MCARAKCTCAELEGKRWLTTCDSDNEAVQRAFAHVCVLTMLRDLATSLGCHACVRKVGLAYADGPYTDGLDMCLVSQTVDNVVLGD